MSYGLSPWATSFRINNLARTVRLKVLISNNLTSYPPGRAAIELLKSDNYYGEELVFAKSREILLAIDFALVKSVPKGNKERTKYFSEYNYVRTYCAGATKQTGCGLPEGQNGA